MSKDTDNVAITVTEKAYKDVIVIAVTVTRHNKFICLTCGHRVILHPDHPANNRAKDGIVYRGSCEICTP